MCLVGSKLEMATSKKSRGQPHKHARQTGTSIQQGERRSPLRPVACFTVCGNWDKRKRPFDELPEASQHGTPRDQPARPTRHKPALSYLSIYPFPTFDLLL